MTAYTDFHYSPTGSGVISGAQVLEQTEQGINGLGQYVQDNVSGAIDTANQALTIAHSADSNATTALNLANGLNAQIIAANQTAGNALTTAQSAQNTANAASSLATTANNNATTALNTANAASAGVTTLTGTVNSLGNRMTAAENAINANAGNITTLQNGLATTNANVTAASNAASSAQATATSAQSTATLARNQAYVLRYTGTTITGGGTIAYTDIDNTDNIKAGDKIIDISGAIYAIASVDTANQTVTVGASPVINLFCDAENLIPAANDAYDLGSTSKQWLNTYSKGYYYNGVAWGLDKSNTWTQNQAINNNNPKIYLKNSNITKGVIPSSNQNCTFMAIDSAGEEFGRVLSRVTSTGATYTWLAAHNLYKNGTLDTTGADVWANVTCYINSAGVPHVEMNCDLYPNDGITNASLGTSTNKWKTLNGVNPGSLSFPSSGTTENTDWFNVAGSILPAGGNATDFTGGSNYFTPSKDGWLALAVVNCESLAVWSSLSYGLSVVAPNTNENRQLIIPVVAGKQVEIKVKGTRWYSARLIVTQGNV